MSSQAAFSPDRFGPQSDPGDENDATPEGSEAKCSLCGAEFLAVELDAEYCSEGCAMASRAEAWEGLNEREGEAA